jgi:hypothetical protein
VATNIFGQEFISPEEYARQLWNTHKDNPRYDLMFKHGTKQAISLTYNGQELDPVPKNGIYMIYLGSVLVYIGSTMSSSNSIRSRLGRWSKELFGKNSPKEGHPAAKKYNRVYGNNIADLKILIIPCVGLNKKFMESVEKYMIYEHKPRFNSDRSFV